MGLFDKIREPIILKDGDSLKKQLVYLEESYASATGEDKEKLEKEINNIKTGINYENKIMKELKNSHMPMYVIHDLNSSFNNKKTHIDFLVITRGATFVLETKNLWGNINVDKNGNFFREDSINEKEEIPSPFIKNNKTMGLIQEMRTDGLGFIRKALIKVWFPIWYHSFIVTDNALNIVNDTNVPEEIKRSLVDTKNLIWYMERANQDPDVEYRNDKNFTAFANEWLARDIII